MTPVGPADLLDRTTAGTAVKGQEPDRKGVNPAEAWSTHTNYALQDGYEMLLRSAVLVDQ